MRDKWQKPTQNMKIGDLVLVIDDRLPRRQWPLAVVADVKTGRDGLVRSCTLRGRSGVMVRPVTKLCLVEGAQ